MTEESKKNTHIYCLPNFKLGTFACTKYQKAVLESVGFQEQILNRMLLVLCLSFCLHALKSY